MNIEDVRREIEHIKNEVRITGVRVEDGVGTELFVVLNLYSETHDTEDMIAIVKSAISRTHFQYSRCGKLNDGGTWVSLKFHAFVLTK